MLNPRKVPITNPRFLGWGQFEKHLIACVFSNGLNVLFRRCSHFHLRSILLMTEETLPQSRSQDFSAKAAKERRRCRVGDLTKAELREAAIREPKSVKEFVRFRVDWGH